MRRSLAAAVPLAILALCAESRAQSHVAVEIVPDTLSISPGRLSHVAVVLSIEEGWHVYWLDSGASGLATTVEASAPPGFEVMPVRYARPRAFVEPQGTVFGYAKEAVLVVPIRAPSTLPAGKAHFEFAVTWLACRESCVLGTKTVSLDLDTVPAGANSPVSERFAALGRRIPAPITKDSAAKAVYENGAITVTGEAGALESAAIFPIESPGVTYGARKASVRDGRFTATVDVKLDPRNARGREIDLRGVVTLGEKPDDPSHEFAFTIPPFKQER